MITYAEEMEKYKNLNSIAKSNAVVMFGSTFMKNIDFGEIGNSFNFDLAVYNRSFTDLSVFDAQKLLESCVLTMSPKKILLSLGETDLERGNGDIREIVLAYEKLIDTIYKSDRKCKIVIVSVCSTSAKLHPEELNNQLELLAKRTGSVYVDITSSIKFKYLDIKVFDLLRAFMLDKITFYDAMTLFQ